MVTLGFMKTWSAGEDTGFNFRDISSKVNEDHERLASHNTVTRSRVR